MEFFCWNVLNRSLRVKNRRVPLYSPWAFSIMAEFSKWRISKILKFLSLQIQAYYILLERIFHAEQLFCLRKSLKMYSMWVKYQRSCQNDVIIFRKFFISYQLYKFSISWKSKFDIETYFVFKRKPGRSYVEEYSNSVTSYFIQ